MRIAPPFARRTWAPDQSIDRQLDRRPQLDREPQPESIRCYDRSRFAITFQHQREEEPMYRVPDVDEVMAVAKELGIHLGPEEVGLYRQHLLELLGELDSFVQA